MRKEIVEKINDNFLVAMELLEKVNISVQDMTLISNLENTEFTFEREEIGNKENKIQQVSIQLEEEKNSAMIKQNSFHEYNFQTIMDDPILGYSTYNVDSNQTIIKFKVDGKKLNVYKTTISQTLIKDTIGGRKESIVDINLISDFIKEEKGMFLPVGNQLFPIEKESYSVPKNYRISQGLSEVEWKSSKKLCKK